MSCGAASSPSVATYPSDTMIMENWQLVVDKPVEVQDCKKFTDHFKGIYRIYPNLIKENRKMSTCHRLDLQILRSQLVMPKNLPAHYHTLRAASAQNNSKNRCQKFGILLNFWPNTILIIFQICQKVRNFYFSLEFYLQRKHV